MTVTNPEALWYFTLLIPLFLLLIFFYFRGRRDLQRLTGKWRYSIVARFYTLRYSLSAFCFFIFSAVVIMGISGISWSKNPEVDNRTGLDVIFALDISRSMLADDIHPTRLKKAGNLIISTVNSLSGARFGVVVFKGKAFISVPLTEDISSVEGFVDQVNPSMISSPGTNLEEALKAAAKGFPRGTDSKKVIVLITDGEELSGDVYNAIGELTAESVPVYTITAGTPEGSHIVIDGNPVRDRDGREVLSRPDFDKLEEISRLTYGGNFSLSDAQVNSTLIREMSGEGSEDNIYYVDVVQYRLFILIAITSLALSVFFKEWKWSEMF